MTELNEKDLELIGAARRAITANYDGERYIHTVGAAVRTAGGKIYVGIDVYSVHGACAEQVALGAAMTAGEREFTDIVAVRGPEGAELLPPCGNCRQLLSDYAPAAVSSSPPPPVPARCPPKSCCPSRMRWSEEKGPARSPRAGSFCPFSVEASEEFAVGTVIYLSQLHDHAGAYVQFAGFVLGIGRAAYVAAAPLELGTELFLRKPACKPQPPQVRAHVQVAPYFLLHAITSPGN